MDIGPPSEAWHAMIQMAAETKDAVNYQVKKNLEVSQIGSK